VLIIQMQAQREREGDRDAAEVEFLLSLGKALS
jgi:hypothetical protein